MKAEICQITKGNFVDGYFISFCTKDAPEAFLQDWKGKVFDIEISEHKEKRSKNANAYFHVLVGKIADKMGFSKPFCKNLLLAKYGQREINDYGVLQIVAPAGADMMEREDIHVTAVEDQGDCIVYEVVRPSSTYNTQEMSALIRGTVVDAERLGIETMTPDELERMLSLWKKN